MKKAVIYFLFTVVGGITGAAIFNLTMKPAAAVGDIPSYSPQVRYVNNAPGPEAAVNFSQAAELSLNAVVHIKTEMTPDNYQPGYYNDPFFQFFFGERGFNQPQQKMMSSGSGVIISSDGYIATNNHVIKNASRIEVVLNDKRSFEAEVIGRDPNTDLALLKINEKELSFINYGNSDEVKVGDWVLAVGNPFNLTSTVTAGIVSAKGRNINMLEGDPTKGMAPVESFIQTDAAVNPGNSGGALVNTSGQLVGINTAIASNTGSYAGYAFAIPVNVVKKVMKDLIEFGSVQRAFIGVSIRDIDAKLAAEKKIKDLKGVYVAGLTDGGSAKDAGIKEGDIIRKVGNVEVTKAPELQEQISKFRPGDKVLITLTRDGDEKELMVTLKGKNGDVSVAKPERPTVASLLGATFEQIGGDEKRKLKLDHGVKITSLMPGKFRSAGIQEGFIITHVDKKPMTKPEDINQALEDKKGGVLVEGVYPNGLRAYYGFGM